MKAEKNCVALIISMILSSDNTKTKKMAKVPFSHEPVKVVVDLKKMKKACENVMNI